MATSYKLFAKFEMIVNFAIEHNPQRLVFIADRLMSSLQVNNAETPHSQSSRAVEVESLVIRAAMYHHAAHLAHGGSIGVQLFRRSHYSGDSTHRKLPLPRRTDGPRSENLEIWQFGILNAGELLPSLLSTGMALVCK